MNKHELKIRLIRNALLGIVTVMFFISDSVEDKLNQVMTFLFLSETCNILSK